MILNRLTLVNFGVYRGQHEFNLRPTDPSRPIILFGGKNGAGKTTLLEAIRLCLYGPLALDRENHPNKTDYQHYLCQRIHHASNLLIPIDMASVELEFEYAVAGERQVYAIKREWYNGSNRFKEALQVFENGRLLTDLEADQWQDFLKDLIPPGLSQLFFFDGERIQALAETGEQTSSQTLAQAIKTLLGLNIVDQLQSDLTIYRRRQQKRGDLDSAERQLEQLEDELNRIKNSLAQLTTKQGRLKDTVCEIEEKVRHQEDEIARLGGGFARQRDEYKVARIRIEAEIEQVEQALRNLCAELLPFAIVPDYTEKVKEQLLKEAELQQWEAARSFIEEKLEIIQREIAGGDFWYGTGAEILVELQQAVSVRITQTLKRLVEPPEQICQTPLRHRVSAPEQRQLLQWIEASQTYLPEQVQSLTTRLTQLTKKRRETEQALQRVPADDVLAPMMEKLNDHLRELGAIQTKQNQLEEEYRKLELQLAETQRKHTRALESQRQGQRLSSRIHKVVDVQLVLDDFYRQLTRQQVRLLEQAFTRNFNRLSRKNSLVERVEIDPDRFLVTLIASGGQERPKSDLSAGEKQIYAISMLWALRQVSGRPLPVIIDTPLGRLDSDHRRNLIEHYFPQASHQVIIFSTDTEVDAEFFMALQPKISQAYRLEHDEQQQITTKSQGYFWTDGRETQ